MSESTADPGTAVETAADTSTEFDAIVIGAGFAGIYMLHQLRKLGLSARLLEAGDDVGGTWYWNRYPGARCDSDSLYYSFSFDDDLDQDYEWPERFAVQPEVMKYLSHVTDRHDLRRDIQFGTYVTSLTFDDATSRWTVGTRAGEEFTAKYCITAMGCLSLAYTPDFKGLDTFEGIWHHTGKWPHEGVDFTGKRVAVVGTGASGVQVIPIVAEVAEPARGVPAHAELRDPRTEPSVGSRLHGRVQARLPDDAREGPDHRERPPQQPRAARPRRRLARSAPSRSWKRRGTTAGSSSSTRTPAAPTS